MNRQHDLPEIDDPADVSPLGRRRRDILEPEYYDDEPAMPSWSWGGLAILALGGIVSGYLIYRGVKAIILYAVNHVI